MGDRTHPANVGARSSLELQTHRQLLNPRLHPVQRVALTRWPVAALCAGCIALAAEPTVIDLWPSVVPGDVGITAPETSRIHQSPLVGPTKLLSNVTKPTLTLHRVAGQEPATAMLICPGGGYHNLYWELEGEEVAAWLNSIGITGIILKYRVPRRPNDDRRQPPLGPLLDAQRAVSVVRSRAEEW